MKLDPNILTWMLEQSDEALVEVLFSAGRIPFDQKEYWLALMPKLRNRQYVDSSTNEALERIMSKLRKAGAKLPIDNKGTIESAMQTGLSIALLVIEDEMLSRISRQSIEDRLHVSQQMDEEADDDLAARGGDGSESKS